MQAGGIVKRIPAAEMRFAMAIFENAALMKTPRPHLQERGATVVNNDGEVVSYRLADNLLTRGITAVIDHYKEQNVPDEDRHAIAWRVLFIPGLARHPACVNWIRETDTKLELEEAVIETLASYPMRFGRDVSIDDFFRQVEIASGAKPKLD